MGEGGIAAARTAAHEERWARWLLERNRRGLQRLLFIVLLLYPAFAALDVATAPSAALPVLLTTRVLVTAVTLCMFAVVRSPRFEKWLNAISAGYMLLCASGLSVMTVFMGGLSSPYYAGLTLAIVATGLLFVWPRRVAAPTHVAIITSFVALNLLGEPRFDFTAFSNLAFLVSTALIVATGQRLHYGTHELQLAGQVELEEAKASLEKAARDLQQLSRFKSEFFANITHELRTPLATILSPLELLLSDGLGPISEAQRGTFTTMFKSGLKLLKLIGDLLDLSRLEESRLRLQVAEHDLIDLLRGLIAQIAGLAQRKNIEVKLIAVAERAFLWCDAEQIERVFVNLLSNAIKFTEPGGRVEVRASEYRRPDGESALRIEVQDDGPGFPPESASRLFERFYQVDMGGTRRHGGAGIGLALARELVELHGGSIRAASAPGEGACFTVELRYGRGHFKPDVVEPRPRLQPARETDEARHADWTAQLSARGELRLLEVAELTERRVVERDADGGGRLHSVLVVEDMPEMLRLVHMALHKEFKVLAAQDGAMGLELARRELPNLIVTDWMMPGMSGLELVKKLREDPLTRPIPVIMLTARADLRDKVAGIDQGANAYLTKPFSPKELLSTARQLVNATEETAGRLLAQRMDSLEIVAGGLAHEINNPLNYLKNSLVKTRLDAGKLVALVRAAGARPLTEDEGVELARLETRIRDMFGVAESGILRIARTVELMRGYGVSGYQRTLRPYDLRAAAEEMVRLVLPATGRNVKVETAFSGDGVVECVPEELNQVLTNLTQNAIEAVSEDGGGWVRIAGSRERGELIVSVRDNGPGIRPEDRARLFTPFFTTKGPGKGMGLGLNICWRVVRSLGGSLEVRSPPDGGAEFVMRLPIRQPQSGAPAETPALH
jgi:signal transduction histidine kinase